MNSKQYLLVLLLAALLVDLAAAGLFSKKRKDKKPKHREEDEEEEDPRIAFQRQMDSVTAGLGNYMNGPRAAELQPYLDRLTNAGTNAAAYTRNLEADPYYRADNYYNRNLDWMGEFMRERFPETTTKAPMRYMVYDEVNGLHEVEEHYKEPWWY